MKEGKKKLLVFHQSLAPYRIDFWNSLNEEYDFEIYFIYKNLLEQKFNQQQLRHSLNFKCNYLTSGFRIGSRAFRWGFLSRIKNFNPDIVFTYEYSQTTLFIYFIRKLFGFKFKIYSICDDSFEIAKNCKGLRKKVRNFLVPKLDGLIVVSEQVADWYENNFRLKEECVSFPIVSKESEFRNELTASIGKSNLLLDKYNLIGKKCILFVGRLVNVKGTDRVIKAFANISKNIPEAVLTLVGGGKEQESLEKLTVELGIENKVLFVGRLEGTNLYAWYNVGQVFILASHHEPFGAVVNEALLAGQNVLCSSSAGAAGLIKQNINGNLFDPYNIELLSELLEKELQGIGSLTPITSIRPSKMQKSFDRYFVAIREKIDYVTTNLLLLCFIS